MNNVILRKYSLFHGYENDIKNIHEKESANCWKMLLSNIEHLGSRFNNDHVRTRVHNFSSRFLQIQQI